MYVKRIQGAICSPNSFEVWRSSDAIWKQTKMQAFQSQHHANQHLRSWSASDQSTLFKRETKKQHTSKANFAISPMSSFESPPFQNSKWTLQNTQINPPFGIPGIFPPRFSPVVPCSRLLLDHLHRIIQLIPLHLPQLYSCGIWCVFRTQEGDPDTRRIISVTQAPSEW